MSIIFTTGKKKNNAKKAVPEIEVKENPIAEIEIEGFGKMKFELLNEYLKKIPDNDIIVLLDGFDTKIVRNPYNLKRDFMSLNTKILFSKDEKLGGNMTNLVFSLCRHRQ